MTDRTQEAEEQLSWPPLPPAPRRYRRPLAKAAAALVAYVLDGDTRARARIAPALDAVADHRAFPRAPLDFRIALLTRCGTAHNWRGVLDGDDDELGLAIDRYRSGQALASPGTPAFARLDYGLSNSLLVRFQDHGDPADLEAAWAAARRSVDAAERDPRLRALCAGQCATVLRVRFRATGERRDLAEAIRYAELAAAPVPGTSTALRSRHLMALGGLLHARYEVGGAIDDLERAIGLYRDIAGTGSRFPWAADGVVEGTLGTLLRNRFLRLRQVADLDEAVRMLSTGVVDDDHPNPARLTNLGNALLTRYSALGDPEDLDRAVRVQLRAVDRTPPGDWQRASRHNNAANALTAAARACSDQRMARAAAEHARTALDLTPPGAPERASREYNLALLLEAGGTAAEVTAAYQAAVRTGLDGSLEWALGAALRWGEWAASRAAHAEAAAAYGQGLDIVGRLFQAQLVRADREAWLGESQGLAARAAHALTATSRPSAAVLALETGSALLVADALARNQAAMARLRAAGRADLADAYAAAAEADAAARRNSGGAERVVLRTDAPR